MTHEKNDTLVIISPGFPAHENDSTCLPSVQSFVLALNEICPSLHIVIIALGFPFRRKPYRWKSNLAIPMDSENRSRLLVWKDALLTLRSLRRRKHVRGIVSLWCLETALVGSWYARFSGVPHRIWIHGQDARKNNPYVRLIRPRSFELIALSDFLQNEFAVNHQVKPAYVIRNGTPSHLPDLFQPRTTDILGVGSLIPLKQFEVLIEVVLRLINESIPVTAIICGDGPEYDKLSRLIQEKNLENHIELRGEVPHDDTMLLMSQSKILLHPSSYEGYSTACLEALAMGCTVISFMKAESNSINKWLIAHTVDDMVDFVKRVLLRPTDSSRVIVNKMTSSAAAMLDHFKIIN